MDELSRDMSELLKSYYKKMKRIEYLKKRYERLSTNVSEVSKCISNASHTLEVLLPSQRYDNEKVTTSKTLNSPQENALIKSEERMEKQILDFQRDQEDCLLERYELEGECEELRVIIESLDDEDKKICEMRFKEKRSHRFIGDEICLDQSTVHRKIRKIYDKFAEELGLIA